MAKYRPKAKIVRIENTYRHMYLFCIPWDNTPDESGVFFYAKNPDEIWACDAHFPDDKIKTFQELSHYRKKYWTFIKNEYMIKTTARSKKGQIERKDTS